MPLRQRRKCRTGNVERCGSTCLLLCSSPHTAKSAVSMSEATGNAPGARRDRGKGSVGDPSADKDDSYFAVCARVVAQTRNVEGSVGTCARRAHCAEASDRKLYEFVMKRVMRPTHSLCVTLHLGRARVWAHGRRSASRPRRFSRHAQGRVDHHDRPLAHGVERVRHHGGCRCGEKMMPVRSTAASLRRDT
jgi:hypothetical protein